MNRDTAQGNWKQLKGKMQVQWGKLTGDYLHVITGRCTQIAGERQCAYGLVLSKTLTGTATSRYPASRSPSRITPIKDPHSHASIARTHTHKEH